MDGLGDLLGGLGDLIGGLVGSAADGAPEAIADVGAGMLAGDSGGARYEGATVARRLAGAPRALNVNDI